MALTRGIRLHQYLYNWLIRAQSQKEVQVSTQTMVDLTQSLGWIINKVQTQTYSGVFVRGLRIPPRFRPCKTHSREMAQTSGFDPTLKVKTCFDCKMFDVANWVACLNGENDPGGTPSHGPFSFISRSTGDILSCWTASFLGQRSPKVVAKSHKCDERCRPSSQRPQYPNLTDASNEGWGTHLEQVSTMCLLSDREKRLHINVLELKAISLALQRFKDQCQKQTVLVAVDN